MKSEEESTVNKRILSESELREAKRVHKAICCLAVVLDDDFTLRRIAVEPSLDDMTTPVEVSERNLIRSILYDVSHVKIKGLVNLLTADETTRKRIVDVMQDYLNPRV